MKRLRFGVMRWMVAVGCLGLLAASCGVDGSTPPADAPIVTAPPSDAVIDWTDETVRAEFEGGWSIGKCEGDGPWLCVERDGMLLGIVEAISYPVESFDSLDPETDDATNLEAFAAGFLESIGADREAGCGADYGFDPLVQQAFGLGGTEGISYGYIGTMPHGAPSELNLQYAVMRGDDVLLVTAIAYDEGGCPGRDDTISFTSADLTEFRPHLERVLTDSPLPTLDR